MLRCFLSLLILFMAPQVVWAARTLDLAVLPAELQAEVKSKFPQAFEKNPKLADADEILRYLMLKGLFEYLQFNAVAEADGHERLVLKAEFSQRINEITFVGTRELSSSELSAVLGI